MSSPQKILFFLNHPAHFHLFKNIIKNLKIKGHAVVIVIVSKDVLENLVKEQNWEYINLFPEGRRSKKLSIYLATFIYFFKTLFRMMRSLRHERLKLLVGTERTIVYYGFLMNIPSFYVNEDDTVATPENYLTYPLATKVIMPECCDQGRWERKKITYKGYHEIAYLHPVYFTPNDEIVKSVHPSGGRYFILRLAELSASHDSGKKGIDDTIAQEIVKILQSHGQLFISSERPLKPEWEQLRLNINPEDIHHVLYFADLYSRGGCFGNTFY